MGELSLAYAADQFGQAELTLRATDPQGFWVETTVSVEVAAVNDAPTGGTIDDLTVPQGLAISTIDLRWAFTDVDDAVESLTFEVLGVTNADLFVSQAIDAATGVLTLYYDPGAFGQSDVTLRATDAGGLSAGLTFNVIVNAAPRALGIANISVVEDAAPTTLNLRDHFSDAEDGSAGLTFEVISNSNPGVVVDLIDGSELVLGYERDAFGLTALIIRATDSAGSFAESMLMVDVRSVNDAPTVGVLLDGPDPAIIGADLTLEVSELTDDSTGVTVHFYRDLDGDGKLDRAVDQWLGADSDGGDGHWSITVPTTSFGIGAHTYFAQAIDSQGLRSSVVSANGTVGIVGIVDDSQPGYSETGSGWTDGSAPDSYENGHREHAAGDGSAFATWAFTGLQAAPHRIFISWPDGSSDPNRASNATYVVKDGQQVVGTYTVDQRNTPASFFDGARWWHQLDTFDVENGSLTITLSDDADGTVIADAIRVLDPVPTIEYLGGDRSQVIQGTPLLLTAYDVIDLDGSVQSVEFYHDLDGNGTWDGTDVLIGTDTIDGDGWTLAADTSGLSAGAHTFFAIAIDDQANPSDPVAFQATVTADITSGLVGHWRLNDGGGSVAIDTVGDNDGTLTNGPQWIGGVAGQGLAFDGVNDSVVIGNPSELNFTGQITISAWVNVESTNGMRNILAHGHALSPNGEVFLRINNGQYQIGSWDGTTRMAQSAVATEDVGNWVHLAGVYDGTHWRLYRNGVEAASATHSTGAVTVNGNWAIGARGTGTERFFHGSVDEVRVYNRGLSASEVAQLIDTPTNTAPAIEDASFKLSLGSADGTVVGDVVASDPNADDSLTFEIVEGNEAGVFAIDASTGRITLADSLSLDFGATPTYELIVKVSDSGDPTLTDLALVQVHAASLTDGLVSHWQFNDATGSTATDSVGSNDGTLAGDAAWTSGLADSGVLLDGSGDYIALGNPAELAIAGRITISAWIKPESMAGFQNIVVHGHSASPPGEVFLRINSGKYEVGSWDGSDHLTQVAMSAEDLGQWVHLTGVYDGTHWRLYRNGVEVSATESNTGAVPVNENWGIGARGTGTERFFNGVIDEVRIYDRALTGTEAAMLVDVANAPPMIEDAVLAIATDALVGTLVGTVKATDANPGNVLSYTIIAGDPSGAFAISSEGNITIASAAALDWINNPIYELTVHVTDDSVTPLSDTATIAIVGADLTEGLAGHWRLDEGSGNAAADSSGSNNGTLSNGPQWIAGASGEGLQFDGVNDSVIIGNPAELAITGDISISAWIRPEATDGLRNIVAHGHALSPNGEVVLRINNGQYQVGSWNGTNYFASSAVPAQDIGEWVHLTGIYDGTHWRLYRNGVEVAATESAVGAVTVNEDWAIGARGTGSERYFKGAIDEIRIYDRTLSALDIAVLARRYADVIGLSAASAVMQGSQLELTATVHDPGNAIDEIRLYRDANANGMLDVGIDTLITADVDGVDGWGFSIDTAGLSLGSHTFFAESATALGTTTNVAVTVAVTQYSATIDQNSPGFSTSGSGWVRGSFGADAAVGGDYLQAYSQQGGNKATWTFTDLPEGTFDVYVTYGSAPNFSPLAAYTIYDASPDAEGALPRNKRVGTTTFIDQSAEPTADWVADGHNWQKIGRATVSDGNLSVELISGGSVPGWLIADAIRLERIDHVQAVLSDVNVHVGTVVAESIVIDLDTAFSNVESLTGPLSYTFSGVTNPSVIGSIVIDNQAGTATIDTSGSLGDTSVTFSATDGMNSVDVTIQINVNDDLIVNGSFEQHVVNHPANWNIYQAIPGWDLDAGPNFELQRGILGGAQEGQQHAELDADENGPDGGYLAGEKGSSTISQTVATEAGRGYQLSYYQKRRPASSDNGITVKFLDVAENGQEVEFNTSTATSVVSGEWELVKLHFIAVGDQTKIQFSDTGSPNNTLGSFLDNVSLRQIPGILIDDASALEKDAGETSQAKFTISIAGNEVPASPIKVKWQTKLRDPGVNAATDGIDYTGAMGEVVLNANNEFSETVNIDILGDGDPEGIEYFDIEIEVLEGFAVEATTSGEGKIYDDEDMSLDMTVTRLGHGFNTVTVHLDESGKLVAYLSDGWQANLAFDAFLSGDDWNDINVKWEFVNDDVNFVVEANAYPDDFEEGITEFVTITPQQPYKGVPKYTVSLIDGDGGAVFASVDIHSLGLEKVEFTNVRADNQSETVGSGDGIREPIYMTRDANGDLPKVLLDPTVLPITGVNIDWSRVHWSVIGGEVVGGVTEGDFSGGSSGANTVEIELASGSSTYTVNVWLDSVDDGLLDWDELRVDVDIKVVEFYGMAGVTPFAYQHAYINDPGNARMWVPYINGKAKLDIYGDYEPQENDAGEFIGWEYEDSTGVHTGSGNFQFAGLAAIKNLTLTKKEIYTVRTWLDINRDGVRDYLYEPTAELEVHPVWVELMAVEDLRDPTNVELASDEVPGELFVPLDGFHKAETEISYSLDSPVGEFLDDAAAVLSWHVNPDTYQKDVADKHFDVDGTVQITLTPPRTQAPDYTYSVGWDLDDDGELSNDEQGQSVVVRSLALELLHLNVNPGPAPNRPDQLNTRTGPNDVLDMEWLGIAISDEDDFSVDSWFAVTPMNATFGDDRWNKTLQYARWEVAGGLATDANPMVIKDGKFDNFGFPDIPLPLILDLQDLVIATQIDFKVGLDVNMDGGLTGNLNGNQNGISELQLASQVYLYWFNIRVDSNNNGRVNWNDDPIELDPTRPGKWIKTTAPHIKKWDVPLDVYIGGKGLPAGHSIMWSMELLGLKLLRNVNGVLEVVQPGPFGNFAINPFDENDPFLLMPLDPDRDGHERFYLKAETASERLADKYVDFGVMANDDGENPPFTFFPLTHEGGDRYDRVLLTAYDPDANLNLIIHPDNMVSSDKEESVPRFVPINDLYNADGALDGVIRPEDTDLIPARITFSSNSSGYLRLQIPGNMSFWVEKTAIDFWKHPLQDSLVSSGDYYLLNDRVYLKSTGNLPVQFDLLIEGHEPTANGREDLVTAYFIHDEDNQKLDADSALLIVSDVDLDCLLYTSPSPRD